MHIVHQSMAAGASSGVRCISTLIIICMLHIVMLLDSYYKNKDGAVRHSSLPFIT